MAPKPADEVRSLLAAGEWLGPGDVATALDTNRMTVHRMLEAGILRFRVKPGTGGHREVNPDDVLRELEKRTTVHGDPPTEAPPSS